RKPDGVFIYGDSCSVITPAPAAEATESGVARKTIFRRNPGCGDRHRTGPFLVNAGKRSAGEEIMARESKADYAFSVLADRYGREENVCALNTDVALAAEIRLQRTVLKFGTHHKPGNAGFAVRLKTGNAVWPLLHRGRDRRPELTMDKHHLLHALIVRGNELFRLAQGGP